MFENHTKRLVLRDFVEADWMAIFAMSQAPLVMRYQSWLRLASEAEARQWVLQAKHHNDLEPRGAYNLAIIQQDTQAVIGWIGWGQSSVPERGDYDFGYALLPEAWGRGYMTEALQSALDYMFETMAARMVYGECAKSNRASARVMEKSGLRLVDQWIEADTLTSAHETHERYAIRLEEWQQRRRESALLS